MQEKRFTVLLKLKSYDDDESMSKNNSWPSNTNPIIGVQVNETKVNNLHKFRGSPHNLRTDDL